MEIHMGISVINGHLMIRQAVMQGDVRNKAMPCCVCSCGLFGKSEKQFCVETIDTGMS